MTDHPSNPCIFSVILYHSSFQGFETYIVRQIPMAVICRQPRCHLEVATLLYTGWKGGLAGSECLGMQNLSAYSIKHLNMAQTQS